MTTPPTSVLKRKIQTFGSLFQAVLANEPWPVLLAACRGNINPMPEICKRETLRHYAKKSGAKVFIETGTFRGETIEFLEPEFSRRVSIELSREFFEAAQKKFFGRPGIELFCGDSADLLPGVISSVEETALIWLDAHYSGKTTALGSQETPIIKELDIVFSLSKSRHVILIDDAREFGSNPNYPPLSVVEERARRNRYHYECRFDLIRLTPL
ncbi:MAG: hypothetical protein WCS65_17095 [Verrucomicrobiae bacterium]